MEGMPEVPGVEHRMVEARGLRFHVAEAGAGEPLVLLHGWPQHWYLWRGVIPLLSARFRVICPDLRGHGWSDAPAYGYEKEELAGDLLALLDELGLGRVRLAGHDWGGWVGFLACLRAPERFERFLALAIPSPLAARPDPKLLKLAPRFSYQAIVAAPLLGRRIVADGRFIRAMFRAGSRRNPWTDAERECFVSRLREPDRAWASVQLYRSFLMRELPAIARGRYAGMRLRVPTHMMIAERDPVIRPELVAGAERHADDLTIEIVPGHGHFLVDEDPRMIAIKLLEMMGT